jgi:hypothetical protein
LALPESLIEQLQHVDKIFFSVEYDLIELNVKSNEREESAA